MRFSLDRTLQQIAQFPYSGSWCGARYPNLGEMPETYRVITFSDMLLFYRLIEDEQIILFVHMQMTVMDTPTPGMLTR
jgi:plasmid stabilization system protein ParE